MFTTGSILQFLSKVTRLFLETFFSARNFVVTVYRFALDSIVTVSTVVVLTFYMIILQRNRLIVCEIIIVIVSRIQRDLHAEL